MKDVILTLFRLLVKPKGMMSTTALVVALIGSIAESAERPDVVSAWKYEYQWLTNHTPGTVSTGNNFALDTNANILPQDLTPAHVVYRRTRALLDFLAKNHSSKVTTWTLHGTSLESAWKGSSSGEAKFLALCAVRRLVVLDNPVLDFDDILYCEENARFSKGFGIVIQQLHNTTKSGGTIKRVSGIKSAMPVVNNVLPEKVETGDYKDATWVSGGFNSMCLDWEAQRLVFAWQKRAGSGSRPGRTGSLDIYSVNLDGTGLQQLTRSDHHQSHPFWIPGGRIGYVSEERGGYARCDPDWHDEQKTATLYSMKPDGSDQICLSWHETNELFPSIDSKGMIVYTRWDYVDRDFAAAHHIWTSFPDGRDPRAPHGNYPFPHSTMSGVIDKTKSRSQRPWAELYFKAIPNSHKYSAIATSHHVCGKGPLIVIDLSIPDDYAMSQVRQVNTDVKIPTDQGSQIVGCYATPWPLSEEFYLVADHGVPREPPLETFPGIYLLDKFGNRELLHGDSPLRARDQAMWHPIPVKKRSVPPVLSVQTFQGERAGRSDHARATISVMNVYEADFTWPAGIVENRGIKALRIVQILAKPWTHSYRGGPDTAYSMHRDKPNIGYSAGGIPRLVLGTVPVESDGSAYFEAPIGKEIYFQAIDERGLAVQSMRSGTYVHPGEQLTCLGCHENKWEAPAAISTRLAHRRAPSKIKPDIDGSAPLTFARLALPVFETKCTPCHRSRGTGPLITRDRISVPADFRRSAPGLQSTAGYWALEPYVFYLHAEGANHLTTKYHGGSRSEAGRFGALAAPLFKHLDGSHNGVSLTQEEFHRITLWLDCNSLELGSYSVRQADIDRQQAGAVVWPEFEVDPANPAGVELNRPVAGGPKVGVAPAIAFNVKRQLCGALLQYYDLAGRALVSEPQKYLSGRAWSVVLEAAPDGAIKARRIHTVSRSAGRQIAQP